MARLVELSKALPTMPESLRTDGNRVLGCASRSWTAAEAGAGGRVTFVADSESDLTRGVASVLVSALSGLTPEEVEAVSEADVAAALAAAGLGPAALTPSRSNGVRNMVEQMRRQARALGRDLPVFPTLRITASSLEAQGAFAEAQAQYLEPDAGTVARLGAVLREKRIGVVAHFYMDPEVQGALTSAREHWEHINISDSLVMADRAVAMCEAGCAAVCVLGVDFMSENVRAILDDAGYAHVPVYRMAAEDIGCTLAEAAEADQYFDYLAEAGQTPNSVHVVYINTSLITKARADALVPTITCTSSNVVQTILQAFAQVPGAHVWYGPDTYMGRNVAQLFAMLARLPDEEVRAVHPAHTAASVRECLPRLHHYQDGMCSVHHMFGGRVTEAVREAYGDAYLTAHFEVPGEMFTLAMEAKARGMGVVGSTQNILDFIEAKVGEAVARGFPETLRFVLGTETGMVTSIVRRVQAMLAEPGNPGVEVDIVFPVSPDAVASEATLPAGSPALPGGLAVVPGPAAGEGCSADGGCASCPFMKMNSLEGLLSVCDRIGTAGEATLEGFRPRAYAETVGGKTVAQAGCRSILHMRDFQRSKELSDDLVSDITSRH